MKKKGHMAPLKRHNPPVPDASRAPIGRKASSEHMMPKRKKGAK
jgi:hypothetical protein